MPPAVEGTLRVGLVAAFGRWKGQDLFLNAIAGMAATPPVRFYIVGGAIYHTAGSQFTEEELRREASNLGVADRVGFTGFQRDTAGIYRALDVVVHASTQPEPFGRAIAEAMACARPVIVSRAGGAEELFREDFDAVGFEPGDAHDLGRLMRALADDPTRRARLSEQARRSAVERFSRDRLAREVAAAYGKLTRGRVIIAP